jgi:Uma2 family endonuclease
VSAIPKTKLTEAEYLAIERTAEFRSDFCFGELRHVPWSSREHNAIKANLIVEIGGQLRGSSSRTFSTSQRVKIQATGLYNYPEIIIVCGKAEYDSVDRDSLVNPDAIIEVLSPSTETYDRGAKFRQYQQLASVKEYVLISQDEPVCERFVRQTDGTWVLTIVTGLAGELAFATVPIQIPLADIYNGVEFPEKSGPATQRPE